MIVESEKLSCYHCGESCPDNSIRSGEHLFCCTGCQQVFHLIHQHNLDNYYCLNEAPGATKRKTTGRKIFQYLDDAENASRIIQFRNEQQTRVVFQLPQIHCSSCLWLLEHLYQLHDGILGARVNFQEKKLHLIFDHHQISLRETAELLHSIGYEPYINLQDYENPVHHDQHRSRAIKLGISGFCFANIMLISFPEYLGLTELENPGLLQALRYVSLSLSIPLILFGASEFFRNAWLSIRQRYLTIDAPIALAIAITFIRSVYEIISGTGAGYLDSMSGIVFFMLIGRTLQHRTFGNLRFNRDFRSYFPIAVTVVESGREISRNLQDIREGDVVRLFNQEIIPVDGILSSKQAVLDYSFVTGEQDCQVNHAGDWIYAGGKVKDGVIDVVAMKPFTQNSFTQLWNNPAFQKTSASQPAFVEAISKYFALFLLLLATAAFIYWQINDPSKAWDAFTAVLIIACPCTLLLASSYTLGFMMQRLSQVGFFVRNAEVLTRFYHINHVVLDKTGTLSEINQQTVRWSDADLSAKDRSLLLSILRYSTHPLCRAIVRKYSDQHAWLALENVREVNGHGIEAWVNDQHIRLGRADFCKVPAVYGLSGSVIYYAIDTGKQGHIELQHTLKAGMRPFIQRLGRYSLSLLSGDNSASREQMKKLFPEGSQLLYDQQPQDKLNYIQELQAKGHKVLMIGDGMNDAGALKQSDAGISIVENHFSFSPASDVILHADQLPKLPAFIQSANQIRSLVVILFVYSLLYNTIGLGIAVQARLEPVIAAILMPISSISIIGLSWLGTYWIFKQAYKKADVTPKVSHDKNHVQI